MVKTAVIRARVNDTEKEKALSRICMPNDETIKAIEASRAGIGVSKFNSFDDMMKDLNS